MEAGGAPRWCGEPWQHHVLQRHRGGEQDAWRLHVRLRGEALRRALLAGVNAVEAIQSTCEHAILSALHGANRQKP